MKIGDPIFLGFTTFDAKEDKYVFAWLFADGASITPTPIPLTHIGNGFYSYFNADNLRFPENSYEVRAIYRVYHDAAMTSAAAEYSLGEDRFQLAHYTVDTIRNEIIGIVQEENINN